MSAIFSTSSSSTTSRTLVAFGRVFTARLDRMVRYFVCRAAISHLRALDDWALHDMGLGRSEIEAAVRGSASAHHAVTGKAATWH